MDLWSVLVSRGKVLASVSRGSDSYSLFNRARRKSLQASSVALVWCITDDEESVAMIVVFSLLPTKSRSSLSFVNSLPAHQSLASFSASLPLTSAPSRLSKTARLNCDSLSGSFSTEKVLRNISSVLAIKSLVMHLPDSSCCLETRAFASAATFDRTCALLSSICSGGRSSTVGASCEETESDSRRLVSSSRLSIAERILRIPL
ncbi:hypothetical protein IscW_ISCW020149 [Ixodes scapularis]|uniref:Uncharacterized protein n=1 Tax=Ixodes scapularis TaxID=6945 RepID=B7Q165_IXOSC|nr:hypothetical protein IscW_ISCW020149 [Ixodes scapularis]|eukprot:XP_002408951.1 hypothetical protein IscW_ISCW020149 [Ixodes scapularis]